jgi:hypothetical protein
MPRSTQYPSVVRDHAEISRSANNNSIPWTDLASHPDQYYDTKIYKLPSPLCRPADLSVIHALQLVDYFSKTSLVDYPAAFIFKTCISIPASPTDANHEIEFDDDLSRVPQELVEGLDEFTATTLLNSTGISSQETQNTEAEPSHDHAELEKTENAEREKREKIEQDNAVREEQEKAQRKEEESSRREGEKIGRKEKDKAERERQSTKAAVKAKAKPKPKRTPVASNVAVDKVHISPKVIPSL